MRKFFQVLALGIIVSFSRISGDVCPPVLAAEESVQSPPGQFPFVGYVVRDGVIVRAGQSFNFENLGSLRKDDQVVVVGEEYSWYKVKLPLTAKSFVSASFVKSLGENVGEITGARVNVRARPDLKASVVGQANSGEWVRVQETLPGWFRLEPTEQSYGWILKKYVTFQTAQIPPPRIVDRPTRNIYANKRQEERQQQAAIPPAVVYSGVVESLGEGGVSPEIRHRLVVDGKPAYLLQGYRSIIDGFLHNKVKIEGQVEKDVSHASPPVLRVTKIILVL